MPREIRQEALHTSPALIQEVQEMLDEVRRLLGDCTYIYICVHIIRNHLCDIFCAMYFLFMFNNISTPQKSTGELVPAISGRGLRAGLSVPWR